MRQNFVRLVLCTVGLAAALVLLTVVGLRYYGCPLRGLCGPDCDCYQNTAKPGYGKLTLTCGCTLRVRTNIDCCKADYPDLGAAMEAVLSEARKHLEEEVADSDPRPSSGVYERLYLNCGCALVVYKPDSCRCFDREHYPKLVDALNEVYRLAHKYRAEAVPVEVIKGGG